MLQRLLRRFVSGRDGSVMLETALMITILLVLMFGIVDLGRALFTANNLVSAAREGARYGAVDPNLPTDTMAVKDTVIAHFSPFGGPALTRANVAATPLPAGGAYSSIRVRISYRFTWITPIRRFVGAMTDSLHAQAEYHWESQ
jgi:Flp pilus assembly protein TadG